VTRQTAQSFGAYGFKSSWFDGAAGRNGRVADLPPEYLIVRNDKYSPLAE
jgi:hypothetical protein